MEDTKRSTCKKGENFSPSTWRGGVVVEVIGLGLGLFYFLSYEWVSQPPPSLGKIKSFCQLLLALD